MKKAYYIISIVLTLLFMASGVSASADSGLVQMEEIIVTATRDSEEIRNVPANVSVITAQDIARSGAANIVDVLEHLGSINIRTYSGNSSQAMIDIRGFGGDNPYGKTLIMLDGRRLNRPDMASVNWLQIPLSTIERIEITRGAGSVLYGDSAIAGIIHIITKKGKGSPSLTASCAGASYGFHNERLGVSGSEGKFSYSVNGENQKTSGYRDRSTFSSTGAAFDIGYDTSDYLSLNFAISYDETTYDLPGSLTKAQYEKNRRQAANPDDEGSNEYLNANLTTEVFIGDYGSLMINFLYGNKDITSDYASFASYSIVDIDTYGITPKYIFEKDLFGHGNKLIFGVDYYYESLDKEGFIDRDKTNKKNTAELSRESLGFYIRNEFSFRKDLILALGYRDERSKIKGKEKQPDGTILFDNQKIHRGEAYESALTWLIGSKSRAFVKYATVYRYPFLDEQASYYGYSWDSFSTNLEKEKGKSFELGTTVYPFKNVKIGLTLFRIDMEDEIAPNEFWVNENLDKTRHEGAECEFEYTWDIIRLYGNMTYHNAEFRNGTNAGKTVPLVPEIMANAGLSVNFLNDFEVKPEIQYIGSSFQGGDNSNTAEKVGGYVMYDLFFFYRPQLKEKLKITAFWGLENLTDEKHALIYYNGYYPLPGITIKGGISLEF